MALDAWFPLAVYYEDLPDAETHNSELLTHVRRLLDRSGGRRTGVAASWTGDVHDVDRLHLDPNFEWLTARVGQHAFRYLESLGHDLDKMDVHIQRSWPVIAQRGQRVSRHAHHTAHLSAVYYVAAGEGEAAGSLRFFNDRAPNEISIGIGSAMTGGYASYNALNYTSAAYRPVPGRIVFFPAKQTHDVEPNETDVERVSISFDLVLTSRGGQDDGHFEYLMPSPSAWRLLRHPDVGRERAAAASPAAKDHRRLPLIEASRHGRSIDSFSIPVREGHLLWEAAVFAHCSSAAAWEAYAGRLPERDGEDWTCDEAAGVQTWSGCGDWQVYRDAIDRLYLELRRRGIPLEGAAVDAPWVERPLGGQRASYRRSGAALGIHLRLDHDADAGCALQFHEGSEMPLPPGSMAVVGGARRLRLQGTGLVLRFDVDLPAVARTSTLRSIAMRESDVDDHMAFAAATARPLSSPEPTRKDLSEKLRWLDSADRKRRRHEDCPVVRRFLIEHADPASATREDIDVIRSYGVGPGTSSDHGDAIFQTPEILSGTQCEKLCRLAETHMTSLVPDTVDDLPEYQLDLTVGELVEAIGEPTVDALLRQPLMLDSFRERSEDRTGWCLQIFIRMYSPATRPYIAFHSDCDIATLNVALNEMNGDFVGGDLLLLRGSDLQAIQRPRGSALVHSGEIVHGVTRITSGTRYSLILFFNRDGRPP